MTRAGRRVGHEATSRRRAASRIVTTTPPERRGALGEALQAFADAAGEP